MNKILLSILLSFFSILSFSQEKKRFNFNLAYNISSQNFSYDRFKSILYRNLSRDMPKGSFYIEGDFKPTTIQTITLASTIFKNKNYWFELGYFWAETNTATSYGYSVNQQNFPLERKADLWYTFRGLSYGLSRKTSLKRYGYIIPKVTFNIVFGDDYNSSRNTTTINNINGDVISSRFENNTGSGILFLGRGLAPLMLFDAPRLGFDYSVNVYKGLNLDASYSYWLGAGVIENFYNLFNNRQYSKDFYGSAFSLGINYTLFKE